MSHPPMPDHELEALFKPSVPAVASALFLGGALLIMTGLSGCPGDAGGSIGGSSIGSSPVRRVLKPATASADTSSNSLAAGVSTASATPSATPTPSPAPASASIAPTPAPLQTATPQVAVTGLVVSPSMITLFPPAQIASLSIGLATSVQFNGYAQMADGSHGGLSFGDRSGGELIVSPGGLVSVAATASPGIYYVRAVAQVAAGSFQDIPVTVGSTGELDTTVQ